MAGRRLSELQLRRIAGWVAGSGRRRTRRGGEPERERREGHGGDLIWGCRIQHGFMDAIGIFYFLFQSKIYCIKEIQFRIFTTAPNIKIEKGNLRRIVKNHCFQIDKQKQILVVATF
jgi:hypothetical protein